MVEKRKKLNSKRIELRCLKFYKVIGASEFYVRHDVYRIQKTVSHKPLERVRTEFGTNIVVA